MSAMLETQAVLDEIQNASDVPLRCTTYPPSDLTKKIGEFDIICPMDKTWPWWTVTVYHDATLMQHRRRYGGDAGQYGLMWSYEENDEPIADDDATHWW